MDFHTTQPAPGESHLKKLEGRAVQSVENPLSEPIWAEPTFQRRPHRVATLFFGDADPRAAFAIVRGSENLPTDDFPGRADMRAASTKDKSIKYID
jgi:hypothetical protein